MFLMNLYTAPLADLALTVVNLLLLYSGGSIKIILYTNHYDWVFLNFRSKN